MRKIRSIVYRMGFRPKAGSIFHSPSRQWWLSVHALEQKDI